MKCLWRILIIYILSVSLLSCSTRSVSEEEKKLLIQVNDLSSFNITAANNGESEAFIYKYYGRGAWDIKYTYDSPDIEGVTPLYMISRLEFEPNALETISTFKTGLISYKAGAEIGGLNYVEQSELFKWGDETYSAVIKKDESPIGNLVVVRKNNRIFTFMIVGMYFDQSADITELLTPKLETMANYQQKS